MPQKEDDFVSKKKQVQTSAEAGPKMPKKTDAKSPEKNNPDTRKKNTNKKLPDGWQENIIRDSETAKKKGRNGGIKSGEIRRSKRDARDTIQYMLGKLTLSQNIRNNLTELGFEKEEQNNMAARQSGSLQVAHANWWL